MRLYEQLIQKEIEISEENYLKKKYKKALWNFFVAYNLSLSILKSKDQLSRKKNILFKRYLISNKEIDSSLFKKLQKLISNDLKIINEALNLIIEKKEEEGYEFGEFYKPFTIGILDSEFVDD